MNTPTLSNNTQELSDRAGQLGKWFAEYAEHHRAKAEAIEALPGSEAWAKVERNLERARYAYALQDDLASRAQCSGDTQELADELEKALPLLEELKTGQDCEEYAFAHGKGFQAMTYCPDAFEALRCIPRVLSALRTTQCSGDTQAVELLREARIAVDVLERSVRFGIPEEQRPDTSNARDLIARIGSHLGEMK